MRNRSLSGVLACLMLSGLTACASFSQTADQTWFRKPGERLLGSPVPVVTTAREHWQYAWLSEAAYQESRGNDANGRPECSVPDHVLKANGWIRWTDFPGSALAEELNQAHLRVDVWYNQKINELVVSFGGTVFTSGRDWRSNLRWFIPGDRNDEYTTLVRRFIPAFRDRFVTLRRQAGNEALGQVRLISTGHSLGGGLAQQFAYALVPDPQLPRVAQVYAFHSSPVTGYYSVDKAVREENQKQLEIQRIYERGEILAAVRSLLSVIYPPSASEPAITGVRYALTWKPVLVNLHGAVDQHSMSRFATEVTKVAQLETGIQQQVEQACAKPAPEG